jgi:hypothetical protein
MFYLLKINSAEFFKAINFIYFYINFFVYISVGIIFTSFRSRDLTSRDSASPK